MADARAGCAAGIYPRQHLFGTDHLDGVAEVVDLAPSERTGRLHRWIAPRFGDIRQQWQMLRGRRRGDIFLSGEFRSLGALLLLRRARVLHTPIVVIAHDAPAGRIDAACLRGADAVICLSAVVARALTDRLGIPADRVRAAPWGPDLTFAGYRSTGSDHVLSIGKSERDLPTLLTALERTGLSARVYAPDTIRVEWSERLPHVAFRAPYPARARGPLTYEHVLPDLQGAAVFATPLRAVHRPFGLTELDDALALAKPIVMTRNPFIDCDIEAVGCGRWVEVGDVDGWVDALTDFMSSRQRRDDAGQRGRTFAEQRWNAAAFGEVLCEVVQELAAAADRRDQR
jgi:glycosyltransferase involved in cell wall biosynthesis